MNTLVRLITDDDGHETKDKSWHLVDPCNEQGPSALCTKEFFGEGESSCQFEMRHARRGGITCKNCLRIIKTYKAVRL